MSNPQKKFAKIIDRIVLSVNKYDEAEWLKRDSRLNNLMIDKKKAEKKKAMLSAQIIQRQIDARGRDVLLEHAKDMLPDLIDTGALIRYLDDEDRMKLEEIRGHYYLLYDALDSVCTDLQGFFDSIGIDGTAHLPELVMKTRDGLQEWQDKGISQELAKDTKISTLMHDESDALYEHVKKRFPVMYRKIQRYVLKHYDTQDAEVLDA